MPNPRNDRDLPVTKFCRAMEDHRRTEAGRVRTAKEFVAQFFPHDEQKSTDRLFLHMPNDVRGPVLAKWGIRGAKAALKDDDAKVQFVVHDALVAGDIDDGILEEGITPEILVDWIVLADWWAFWRHGKLTGAAIQKALVTAREVGLLDDKWFLENIQGRGGKLRGTDVLCDTLSKDQIIAWLRKVHETGDASPAGLVGALGWETILAKSAQDALLYVLDQLAQKAKLTAEPAAESSNAVAAPTSEKSSGDAPPPSQDPTTARHEKLADAHPTVAVPGDIAALATADAFAHAKEQAAVVPPKRDSGFAVAIPDIPAVDSGDEEDEPPSIPSVEWSSKELDESPKLAQARAAMMQTLISSETATGGDGKRELWDQSEIPAKASSLEWPEPPPVGAAHAPANRGTSSHPPTSDPPISLDESDLQRASSPRLPLSNPPPIPRKPSESPH